MRSALKILAVPLAASFTLAACGSSSSNSGSTSQASAAPASTTSSPSGESSGQSAALVKSASNATLGATVLVDSQGMTLYHLSGERNGKFICTSSGCLGVWHPLSASAGAPSGSVGSLGTVKRPDGAEQVTYKGAPLYTFAQDQNPGDAKGQGIKDVGTWTAVTVGAGSSSGAPAAASPATTPTETTPPASSSGGSKGYGY
jgi:predicted lipoprotein with Yx(FWY)xxD motif